MKYLYRIVNALLAAAFFPAALFLEFVVVRLSTNLFEAGLQETFTLKQIIDILTGKETFFGIEVSGGDLTWPAALDPIKGRLIATVAAFAVAIIAAVFIFVWSICSNKRLPVVISAVVGIASVITMTSCFHSAAWLFVDGTINVVKLFSSGLVASILGNMVNVDSLGFAGFQNGILIVFILILVWSAAFYIVEIGEPKENNKKEKTHSK